MEIDFSGLATVFSLLILSIFLCRYLLRYLLISNRNPNVPLNWPVVGMTPSLLWNLRNFYDWAARVGGSMSFMAGSFKTNIHVITSSPPNLEYILKTNYANFNCLFDDIFDMCGNGSVAYEYPRQTIDTVLNSRDFQDYRINFTQKMVQERLVPVLEEAYKKDSIIDLQEVFLRFAIDSSTCMLFGKNGGDPAASFAKAFDEATEASVYNLIIPPAVCKLMQCLDMVHSKETKEPKNLVYEFVSQMVESRKSEIANNSTAENEVLGTDILSRFTKIEAEEGRSPSDKSLQSLCISIIVASRLYLGALCWFFWLLSKHPEVEDNILLEISEAMDSDQCSHNHSIYGDEWNFAMDELKDKKYLEAVLWESLRLYPPVPVSYTRAVKDDVLPDGTSVKKGSGVLGLIYGANRLDSVWGEDAMEFKPERWIGAHEKERSDKYCYPVLGTDITDVDFMITMKCVAAHVLVRYNVNVDPELCVEPKLALTLLVKDGLPVTLQSREDALHAH